MSRSRGFSNIHLFVDNVSGKLVIRFNRNVYSILDDYVRNGLIQMSRDYNVRMIKTMALKGKCKEKHISSPDCIYLTPMVIPIVFALLTAYPDISHWLVYNHLLTNSYLIYQEGQYLVGMMDSDFVPEDHDSILADFARKMRYVSVNRETFEVTIRYNILLKDSIFSDLTSQMIESFL